MNAGLVSASVAVLSFLGAVTASAQSSTGVVTSKTTVPSPIIRGQLTYAMPAFFRNRGLSAGAVQAGSQSHSPANPQDLSITTKYFEGNGQSVPVWTYAVMAARDGQTYQGAIVGHSPFQSPGTTRVAAIIIPLVLHVHSIATSFDPNTGLLTTMSGETTSDPTQADNVCMQAPNNVPIRVVRESPLFDSTRFVFGGTNVGTTQYLDAQQRASFWNVLEQNESRYHLLLDPVRVGAPVVLDVPPEEGVTVTAEAIGSSICGTFQLINGSWLDWYLQEAVIPYVEGLTPTVLPIFVVYNAGFASSADNLYTCCYVGYHSISGIFGTQTYAVADFDTSELFGDTGLRDTDILAHEIAEWGNDPYGRNMTPSWGGFGQVVGTCQQNLEVGDPLSGTDLPPIRMPNGHDYYLQELAFFSWFYGGTSFGANGWFSNGGSLLTDAGPVCPQ